MDLFYLQAIVTELLPLLTGRRLLRATQVGDKLIALDFNLTDDHWLLISTDQANLSLHLSRNFRHDHADVSRTDTPFVALARKYLKSARLNSIDSIGYDRVVIFEFSATKDQGADCKYRLHAQLTGRAADLVLTRDDEVLATLRDRPYQGRYSLPSPPDTLLDPFLLDEERWIGLIRECGGEVYKAARRLIGFSEQLARELAAIAKPGQQFRALNEMLAKLSAPQAVIYSNLPLPQCEAEIGRDYFDATLSGADLTHLHHLVATRFASANEAADRVFKLKEARQAFLARRQQVSSQLSQNLKRLASTRGKLLAERERFALADRDQRYGDLLLANLHQAVKEGDGITVTDYFDPDLPAITIPARGKSTAREAAEHYFKLARKARHGLQAINERLPLIEREAAEKSVLLAQLQAAVSLQDLEKLSHTHRLVKARPATPKAKGGRKAEAAKIGGVRCYLSSDGYEILVGRSDRDNDHLTSRVAKSYDLWFHAADYPGSHVILRNPQRKIVPSGSIAEAARLAAKFSQARADARVAVNYCERKYVSKPKGFAPGQVRLSAFKTIFVEPGEPAERIY